jgi:hypothetical protein
VERVRKVSPEARSRKTTGAYWGWMAVFIGDVLRRFWCLRGKRGRPG